MTASGLLPYWYDRSLSSDDEPCAV